MYTYQIFADYFQFYLQDEAAIGDLADSWGDEAVERLLAVAPGVVGVGTVRNMKVPVTLEVLNAEPSLHIEDYDHIVECSLVMESQKLVIAGCTDYFPEAARVEVTPGTYRVRILYSNLASLSEDGLDGSDQYDIKLWLAPPAGVVVIKHRAA